MGIEAIGNGIDIEGADVEIIKIMDSNLRRVAEVVVELHFPEKPYPDDQKKMIKSLRDPVPFY